jgi:hypothetical protein
VRLFNICSLKLPKIIGIIIKLGTILGSATRNEANYRFDNVQKATKLFKIFVLRIQ